MSIENWPSKILVYTDGASRGNPGPCALGVSVLDTDKNVIHEESLYLEDSNTNNFAEYKAVICALELAVKNKIKEIHLFSDSEFLIKQLNGLYKVKSKNIKPLFEECQKLIAQIPKSTFEHVRRELNSRADELANQALDSKI